MENVWPLVFVILALVVFRLINEVYPRCKHGVLGGWTHLRCRSCREEASVELSQLEQTERAQRREARREQSKMEKIKNAEAHRKNEIERVRVLLLQNEETIRGLSPQDFEDEIADLFERLGYEVEQTPYVNDGGKDAIIRKDGKVYFVECKQYGPDQTVGRPLLQKFYGAIQESRADGGFMVTTGRFPSTAVEYANRTNITLIDLPALIGYLREADGEGPLKLTLICRHCGRDVVFRIGDRIRDRVCSCGQTVRCDITIQGILRKEGYCLDCAAPLEGNICSRFPECNWVKRRGGRYKRWRGNRRIRTIR